MIAAPVLVSKFPVGSSANRMAGWPANARASADQAEGLIAGSRSPDAAFAALVNEVLG
jgi:hypothetical protein